MNEYNHNKKYFYEKPLIEKIREYEKQYDSAKQNQHSGLNGYRILPFLPKIYY